MVRVYLKDSAITKIVAEWYFDVEWAPEWSTYIDVNYSINDHVVFEWGSVILYKDSQAIQSRKLELEAIVSRSESEQQELDYILSLLA